jgi:hypothetical protein
MVNNCEKQVAEVATHQICRTKTLTLEDVECTYTVPVKVYAPFWAIDCLFITWNEQRDI